MYRELLSFCLGIISGVLLRYIVFSVDRFRRRRRRRSRDLYGIQEDIESLRDDVYKLRNSAGNKERFGRYRLRLREIEQTIARNVEIENYNVNDIRRDMMFLRDRIATLEKINNDTIDKEADRIGKTL